MTDGSLTGRDHVAAIATRIALEWDARGYLREFSPETVAEIAADLDLDVSTRTVRRVLDALANDETGILEDVSEGGRRLYRLNPGVSSSATIDGVDLADLDPVDRETLANRGRLMSRKTEVSFTADKSGDVDDPILASTDRSVRESELESVARSVAETTAPASPLREVLILHGFASWGVESEALSAYGRVIRIGDDPSRNASSDVLRADALRPPVADVFDLSVWHPPCQKWSTLTHLNGDPEAWPNHIPETRSIAREISEDFVIENVPQAPLEAPVVLDSRNFGLPGPPFRRAFETSFHVEEPPDPPDLADRRGPFADDEGGLGSWRGSKLLWRSIKHVSGDYPAEAIKNNGIPAPYIHYLAYWWLRSRPDLLDQDAPTDLASASRDLEEVEL